jgi:hypothetical protein
MIYGYLDCPWTSTCVQISLLGSCSTMDKTMVFMLNDAGRPTSQAETDIVNKRTQPNAQNNKTKTTCKESKPRGRDMTSSSNEGTSKHVGSLSCIGMKQSKQDKLHKLKRAAKPGCGAQLICMQGGWCNPNALKHKNSESTAAPLRSLSLSLSLSPCICLWLGLCCFL